MAPDAQRELDASGGVTGALTPADVTPGSEKKVWWTCDKGHEWQARVYSRSQGNGCPFCGKQRVSVDTSLAAVNPRLAAEWHPTKNGDLTPADVMPGTLRKAWWKCLYGHEWKAVIVREFGQTSDRIARTPVWGKE